MDPYPTELTKRNQPQQREINKSRIEHTYSIRDKVSLTKPGILRKMSTPRQGPYKVEQVFTNGTIIIRRGPVSERVNIRRVQPYFERSDNDTI